MIVCHCEQVSDHTVKRSIARGADCVEAITDACGAGANCGGCTEALEALLMNVERAARIPRWRRHLVPQSA